jgi:hypothetical protein
VAGTVIVGDTGNGDTGNGDTGNGDWQRKTGDAGNIRAA